MVNRPRNRPKLRLGIAIFYLLSILLVLHMFPCKHCPDRFSALSVGGLKQHQKHCQAFLEHEVDMNQRRRATAASSKVRRAKLKDRKMRLGSAAPGVSLLALIKIYYD